MANFTQEQLDVINAKGKVIVSASAGSGKTTVMIAKILRLIQEECVPIRNILAVTFTKKAAAQMKDKLRKELIKAINVDGIDGEKKKFLKEQLCEVGAAEFSTIHAFCSNLLKRHFFEAEIDGGFQIISGDDSVGVALKNNAIDEIFEDGYESGDTQFQHLLSCFWKKKKDDTLRELILSVYEKLRERADYETFLLRSGAYTKDTFEKIKDEYFALVKEQISYYRDMLSNEYNYFLKRGIGKSVSIIEGNLAIIQDLLLEKELLKERTPLKFLTAESTTYKGEKKFDDEYILHVENAKKLWKTVKEIWDKKVLSLKAAQEEKSFFESAETAAALALYVLKFDKKYCELKKERGLLDYADLQLKTLDLLNTHKDVLKEIQERFLYVFVDEYQDVNPLQEELIDKIGGENLFLVGDMKQSIYAFRGGKSVFFDNKCKDFEKSKNSSWLKLSKNFRSAEGILKAVNEQFELLMSEENGSIIRYHVDGKMSGGDFYNGYTGRVKVHFAQDEQAEKEVESRGLYSVKENEGKAEEKPYSAQIRTLVQVIREECSKTFFDVEKQEERQVGYGDIAVLVRGLKNQEVKRALQALTQAGIPVTTTAKENICDYPEILTLIDVLSLIDNEEQDIPLTSVLLSPIGGMTAEDLAKIRLRFPIEYDEEGNVTAYGFFRESAKAYAEKEQDGVSYKLNKFYAYLDKMRTLAAVMGAGELLTKVLSESRMEEKLLARDNGTDCERRIELFISAAGDMNVHAFLRYLKDSSYKIECVPIGGENAVKLMTIHASKGLEFTVVILFGINAKFHGNDDKEVLKVDDDYAIAPRYYDLDEKTYRTTLLRRLYDLKKNHADVLEELNVYYVALTRAKYALHLIGKKRGDGDSRYGNSYADVTNFSVWEDYVVEHEIYADEKLERQTLVFSPNDILVEKVRKSLAWEYGYTGFENMPVKSSATALISQQSKVLEDDAFEEKVLYRDDDAMGDRSENKILLGLSYHAFLEKFDFSCLYDENGKGLPREEILEKVEEFLRGENGLEEEYLACIEKEKCVDILCNPVFFQLLDSRLYKEQQFLVSLPLKDFGEAYQFSEGIAAKATGEEVIFQGAIDLLALTKDGAHIIDYKYSEKDGEYLYSHYKPQLSLYKKAVARIFRLSEDKIRCTIVNIRLGFEVSMD